MGVRTLFTINIPISALFGVTCVFAPSRLLSLYGVDLTPAGRSMTQLAGAAFLAFCYLAYIARSSSSTDFVNALAVGLCIQDLIGAAVSLIAQVSGAFNPLGWSTVVIYLALGLGYGYFGILRPEVAPAAREALA